MTKQIGPKGLSDEDITDLSSRGGGRGKGRCSPVNGATSEPVGNAMALMQSGAPSTSNSKCSADKCHAKDAKLEKKRVSLVA